MYTQFECTRSLNVQIHLGLPAGKQSLTDLPTVGTLRATLQIQLVGPTVPVFVLTPGRPNERQQMGHQKRSVADKGCKISWKTKTSLERRHCGATGSGMDKDSKGQRKLEDSGGGLHPAVEGHSLE